MFRFGSFEDVINSYSDCGNDKDFLKLIGHLLDYDIFSKTSSRRYMIDVEASI
jgi:hypothetical protein